ncbi:hypothetical protein FQR65_LT20377 [Abscondita terminalis]|nr:hypothetical protein FQR65_LT20377 [Abscondita terminalis]
MCKPLRGRELDTWRRGLARGYLTGALTADFRADPFGLRLGACYRSVDLTRGVRGVDYLAMSPAVKIWFSHRAGQKIEALARAGGGPSGAFADYMLPAHLLFLERMAADAQQATGTAGAAAAGCELDAATYVAPESELEAAPRGDLAADILESSALAE